MISAHVEELGTSLILLTPKSGFCRSFQMIVFHDKNTMFLYRSALPPLVPDGQNDNPIQPRVWTLFMAQ